MKNVSIEQATKVQNELREILIKYNNPEFGDCIVDEICWLFGFPTTTDVEPEGDFEDNLLLEIAGLEIPDEDDKEEVIKFEEVLKTLLKGNEF